MREPTHNEMVEGIAKGVKDFLMERESNFFVTQKPGTYFREGVKSAVADWLRENKNALIEAFKGGQQ